MKNADTPALLSEPSRMTLCGDITLDAEFLGMAAGLCHIVRKLHPKKVVHVRAERFLNAEGHFRGERGLAGEKVQQGSAANFENVGCFGYAQAQSVDDLGSDKAPGWGGFFMGIGQSPFSGSRLDQCRWRCWLVRDNGK